MRQIVLVFALIISFQSRGQITFIDSNTSWNQLSKQAKEQDKLIFIHFENSECVQCNEVASMGFNNAILKKTFDEEFIAIRCNVGTTNGRILAQKFRIMSSLMSLYVDSDGNILHVNNGSTGDSYTYLNGAERALDRKGKKQLPDYEREYKAGVRAPAFMREYMVKKQESSMAIDDLLDEYVTSLPADSLGDFQTVKRIYEFFPAVNSVAYQTIKTKTPKSITDSIFSSAKPDDRKAMNEGILENSFRIAVQKRDHELAQQIAEFARESQSKDRSKGEIDSAKWMIKYYYRIGNTRKYFENAVKLIENKYMPLSIDSLNAMDEAAFKAQQNFLMPKRGKPDRGIMVRSVAIAPPSQFIYLELNEHAYHFYELTRDKELLEKALAWSKKSMDLSNEKRKNAHSPYQLGDPNFIDTYAHILYKLGRKDEAIEWQTKAVEAQKVSGMAYESFEIRLNKMKTGDL
jgi:hypothetical protein